MNRDKLFIGGQWVAPDDGDVINVIEAATERVMGRVATGGRGDINAAVGAAARASSGEWSSVSAETRSRLLVDFADTLEKRARDTAELVTRQNGMPISLSIGANGYFPAILFRYYADLVAVPHDPDIRSGMGGTRTIVTSEPIGVVAAITPWNYPQALAAMKIAPALAAGSTLVLKPDPKTALDAFVFADAAREVGLPEGVINIVPGDHETGGYLVEHSDVEKVAFTGSTVAGRRIAEICGRLLRPVTLELGGKSAAILADDVDLNVYLENLVKVSLPNNGQTCHASTRILVPRSRYSEIVSAISDTVRALRIGDPLDRSTQVGPLVSANQRRRVLEYIKAGRSSGAQLTTGGGVPRSREYGWFVEPTVFADVDNNARIAREEIFGPVLCITPYRDEEEAVSLANDSDYGLAGSVWTADEQHGLDLANRIVTGTIGVNHYGLDPAAPFGGVKASGIGYELGPEGLDAYRRLKSTYLPAPGTGRSFASEA